MRLFVSRKRIAWDAFYSRYDSWVSDRQLIRPGSFKAAYHWLVEWLTCRLVDVIFLDTESHIKFFEQTFNLSRSKFRKVLVGSDDRIFYPVSQKVGDYFAVNFHGNFIPLQGIEVIVRAAKLLEQEGSIRFNILGSGQTFGEISGLVDDLKSQNVKFWPKIDYAQLPGYLAQADVVLGIFGTTPKADRVIPNKVYEAAAMGKPIITAETSAIKELFTDRHDILLCHAGDPADLAAKILELKNKPELATNLGRQARLIFENNARPSLIAKQLLADLD
jgi:glycosyltransferase involved in cell wall biosynthesis